MRGGRRSHAHPTGYARWDMIHAVDLVYSIFVFWRGRSRGHHRSWRRLPDDPASDHSFRCPSSHAVGTDLLYAAATKGAGTLIHGINKTIDWNVVSWLTAGQHAVDCAELAAVIAFRH